MNSSKLPTAEITCPIHQHAQESPHEIAIESPQFTLSYSQLDAALSQHIHTLKNRGITSSSRVAFIAKPTLSSLLLLFALFRLHATACPISFRTPPEQLPLLIAHLSATHLLDPEQLPIITTPVSTPSTYSLNQLATVLMTSGSSGKPKAACHTLASHICNAQGALHPLQCSPSIRWLLSLPLFHVGGLGILFRTFIAGGTVVLSDLPLAKALHHHQISHASLVPTQLFRLLQEPSAPPSLKCLLVGGAPLSPSLAQRTFNNNLPLFITYGMTEMSSIITLAAPDQLSSHLHQGSPLSQRELQIDSDRQIWVRGTPLFAGYWDPHQQSPVLPSSQGWFPTNDLGHFDQNGQLILLGRKDRLFISGGENIQPEEIEMALCQIPGILAARVFSTEDPEFGQRPVAHLLEEQPSHTLHTIQTALSPLLPSFKHPVKVFTYIDNFPPMLCSPKEKGFS